MEPWLNSGDYDRKQVQKAVDHWNQYTCLRLKPRTNEENYLWLAKGRG